MLNIPEKRRYDCIPVGRIALDINPDDVRQRIDDRSSLHIYVGGSPANTAVGLAKLGLKTGYIGKVSADSFGDFVVEYFKRHHIDTSNITLAEKDTLLALTFTETRDGKTNLLMYRNADSADLKLCCDDISEDYIASSRSIIISGTALSASPSREACFKALELAEKNGTLIVFDIDYRRQSWKSEKEISVYCTLAARYAHIIMGSLDEFQLMDPQKDDEEIARHWFREKAQIVIIKHGKEGSRVYLKDEKRYKVNIVPVDAVKSTGGGDSYASAFLYGLLSNKSLQEALEMATVSASLTVAAHSCSEAMADLDTLLEHVKEARRKYPELVSLF